MPSAPNITMRMQMRRFVRLTNAFSRKFENHMHMVALYTVWYNYVTQHNSLKAFARDGCRRHALVHDDLAQIVDVAQPKPGKRGSTERA